MCGWECWKYLDQQADYEKIFYGKNPSGGEAENQEECKEMLLC